MSCFVFLNRYLALFESDEYTQNRKSILEPMLLLAVKNHPLSSKADLTELIFSDRSTRKSSLDKPLLNLIDAGFLE